MTRLVPCGVERKPDKRGLKVGSGRDHRGNAGEPANAAGRDGQGQLIDGVVNPVCGQPRREIASQRASIPRASARTHPAARAWSIRAACQRVPGLDGERVHCGDKARSGSHPFAAGRKAGYGIHPPPSSELSNSLRMRLGRRRVGRPHMARPGGARTAPSTARTADPVPSGESRRRGAVKRAFPVRPVGDELSEDVAEANLGGLARSKGCGVLGTGKVSGTGRLAWWQCTARRGWGGRGRSSRWR